ncbi:MAG: hypothetical protein ABI537_10110 [Casimicrobiaceae bacterium]
MVAAVFAGVTASFKAGVALFSAGVAGAAGAGGALGIDDRVVAVLVARGGASGGS